MLSIIITHYKTLALLKLCVSSIEKTCNQLDYEIIITDSETLCKNKLFIYDNFPKAKFIGFQENVGYAKMVNAGIKKATRDFILILNADIVATDGAIFKLINFLKNNPKVGLVGPQLLDFSGEPQNSCFRFYTPLTILLRRTFLGRFSWGKKKLDKFLMKKELTELRANQYANEYGIETSKEWYLDVGWLMGSALMARRDAVRRVGFLDEAFFMYFEDVDWAKRFWDAGYKVAYLANAEMYHYHQKASSRKGGIYDILVNKYTRAHIKSAFKYFRKHGVR